MDAELSETSVADAQSDLSELVNEGVKLALVKGQPFEKIPNDLYIPPDALKIFLEAFQGPLDLLLYLIKRNNMDILDIQVAEITRQYMAYISLMKASQFELAGEYLVMAATLAEIKSRMLLPRTPEEAEEEEDPRAELIRRLQEYERFKQAAEDIDALPREGRDTMTIKVSLPEIKKIAVFPDVKLQEIFSALHAVMNRGELFTHHVVEREIISTRERMVAVLTRLQGSSFTPFVSLYAPKEGKMGVVVTFIALLELVKESLIELVQNQPFGSIHVKARSE
ncbi:MAG: ScpA family protein [Endozoicomonadaceae bacterium]|nr:ScpA family protein [Endozoicomonadaceae bacterium]MCY4328506.1 ScpA family protein [Endozoicomonadaceae bacterium]